MQDSGLSLAGVGERGLGPEMGEVPLDELCLGAGLEVIGKVKMKQNI